MRQGCPLALEHKIAYKVLVRYRICDTLALRREWTLCKKAFYNFEKETLFKLKLIFANSKKMSALAKKFINFVEFLMDLFTWESVFHLLIDYVFERTRQLTNCTLWKLKRLQQANDDVQLVNVGNSIYMYCPARDRQKWRLWRTNDNASREPCESMGRV